MKLKTIKTQKELEELFDEIRNQGFGYMNSYDAHNSKIDSIKSDTNKLNINVSDYEIKKIYNNEDSYSKIEKDMKKYFSKFKPDDKIREVINSFTIQNDAEAWFPSSRPNRKDIIEWIKLKKKAGFEEDPEYIQYHPRVRFYDFDKKVMKINFSDSYTNSFNYLYELIYGEKANHDVRDIAYGKWFDLGKIEVKKFNNGSMNIKGDLKLMKKYQYDYIQKFGQTNIYRINKKLIIRNEKER